VIDHGTAAVVNSACWASSFSGSARVGVRFS
jgi:hypothetical protein